MLAEISGTLSCPGERVELENDARNRPVGTPSTCSTVLMNHTLPPINPPTYT